MTAVPAIARASVCIPTHNGARTIGRLLRAVLAQATPIPYDVLVVDTESADGTREIVRSFPVRIRGIHRDEFDHGDTRNLAASLTTGDAIVFLTQDAIPADDQWLAGLLSELEDPRVAGAYSRNLPPPGSSPLVRLSLERDPCGAAERRVHERNGTLPADPTARRLLFDFNNVSSCVRRAAWERFPFPRTSFGEDVLWARGVIESGSRIVFAPGSRVFHGHDDPPAVAGERARVDGRFNALHLGRVAIASLPDALRLGARLSWHDAKKVRSWRERVRAPRVRLAQTFGLWRGGRVRARAAVPRFLERSRLRVLYVVHGFPPESFAGTEVYARQLALAMAARGHDVGVFYRSGAGDLPDLALEESEREGIRHFRVGHALAFRHAGESYAHETVEARFAEALDRFRPEVVHFQHLIHLSARLVGMARERGLATIATLHDYWAVCPRVQLQRPGGRLCGGRRGLGCLLCLKEKTAAIDLAAAATFSLRPLVERAVRRIETRIRDGRPVTRRELDVAAFFRRDRTMIDALQASDLLVSPSRFLRDLVLRNVHELDPSRFVYSDNGLGADGLVALPKKEDSLRRLRFGFVGSLVPYKGADVAIEAMNALDDPRAVLFVFGSFRPDADPYHARLRSLARANVVFRGPFDHARLSEVMSEIDALVVPSTWFENAPLTIREAHLTGTPAIVSDLGGMAESVRPGVDGLVFRAGDAADLAAKLQSLVSDRSRLRAIAREFPERKTIRENAAELEFRYRGVVALRSAAKAG